MKVAIITRHLGVQHTMASTAFVTAFADGCERIGVRVRIVGAVPWDVAWNAGPLAGHEAVAPWLDAPAPKMADTWDAARAGILGETVPRGGGQNSAYPDWYYELLLERELKSFARGDDLTLVVYPIAFPVLSVSLRVARRHGWRVVVQSCEAMSGSWIDQNTKDDYIRATALEADGVWVLSDFLGDYWHERGMERERIAVHPNVVRMSAFETPATPEPSTAIYLGNLQHKEIEYLLEISQIVAARVPGYRLRIFGDALPERRAELAAAIESMGIADNVVLEQPIVPTQVPETLAHAHVLVLPRASGEFSTAGFPNKLGEYLASGRPVVVTRVGDIPNYLTDRESAFLVPPDDCDAFAEALALALTDSSLAEQVGATGKRVAEGLLASPVVANRIVDFCAELSLRHPLTEGDARAEHSQAVWRGLNAAFEVSIPVRAVWHRAKTVVRTTGSRFLHWLRYAQTGHTRVVALKMAIMRVLRAVGLRPPE
ncbi:MAG: glycosyltransferase family 4 protein [Coriobacteriia bacterium]|nr:glycosyltransferase family 4 protein [Coriobacteriia bacterium]